MNRPDPSEYGHYYAAYVDKVPPGNILELLDSQQDETNVFLTKINEGTSRHRYAADKWSIREIVGHLADSERVFMYRALRISREDTTPLAGFDENTYVGNAGADQIPLTDLASDLAVVRRSSLSFFKQLTAEQMRLSGTASDSPFSVQALAFIVAGHQWHHLDIIRNRYL